MGLNIQMLLALVLAMAASVTGQAVSAATTFIDKDSHRLRQGTNLGTVTLGLDYEVSFDIVPDDATQGNWANIIHFTGTGTDCCAYGSRIPAIWFRAGTRRMYIIDGHGPNGDDLCQVTDQLPANQRTNIKMQMLQDEVRVYYNDSLKCTEARRDRRQWNDVTVYASDPWYLAALAKILNFKYRPLAAARGYDTFTFVGSEGRTVQRSEMIGSAYIPVDYAIGFDIIPRGTRTGWTNVLHISATDTDCCGYGSRIPGVWFYSGTTRFYFIDGHAEFGDDVCNIPENIPQNQLTTVYAVFNLTGVYIYYNSTLKCTEPRADRSVFPNAKVYLSDRYYAPANAEIYNFFIDDLSVNSPPALTDIPPLQDAVATLNASMISGLASVNQAIADLTSDTTTNRTNLRTELMGYITSVNQSVQTVSNNMYTSQLAINSSIQSLRTDLISQNTSLKTLITQGDATVAGTVTTLTTTVNNINTTLASMMVSGDQAVKDMLSPVKDMAMATNQTLQSLQGLLSSKLSALSAFAVGPGSGSGTDSPQITTDGTDMTVDAMNGRLMVGSSQCGATDLCDALKALGDVTSMLSDVGNGV